MLMVPGPCLVLGNNGGQIGTVLVLKGLSHLVKEDGH